ncbi:MAG: signal peptidase I [Chloroflexi bacterium]|nr:signal peptidase I [Chloroflexota bacterium]
MHNSEDSSTQKQKNVPFRNKKNKGLERFNTFSNKYASWAWIITIALLGIMFYLNNSPIMFGIEPNIRFYLILPLLWIIVGLVASWGWKYGLEEKPKFNKFFLLLAIGAGITQVLVALISGLLFKFGKSPYTHSFPYILGNALFVITYLAGLEFSRAYLLARYVNKKPLLIFLLITISFTALIIPLGFYTKFSSPETAFIAVGSTLMPSFSKSMLATYLAWIGGPLVVFAYGIIVTLFEWLSPILPKLSWMVTAFLETLTPMILLLIVNQLAIQQDEGDTISVDEQEQKKKEKRPSYLWVGVAVLGVALVWFNMGLFGIRPYLVSGISMRPTLKAGDVVVIEAVSPREIAVGDVILFKGSKVYILHRVIEINSESGKLEFITQGDGLSTIDDPVSETQIEGKMVASVPKIGWVAIGIRRALGYDQIPMPK